MPMPTDGHVRVLSTHVVNKIAAGEVVDRPASVVKELVENALDAGATQIDVEITAGGRKLVAVRDNGTGMGRDDALLSIERHATSKIRDVDDIERIATLGFRGEALAAIASVSRFRLVTCRAGEVVGTEITIAGGTLRDVRETGCPAGTAIEVRDLFFNVPARRKFLRSYPTEMGHVRAAFLVQALSHAEVGMGLKVDGRETYRLPARGSLEERLRALFGTDCQRSLKPVEHRAAAARITGFVSLPSANRADRDEQYVFVNGRSTSAPVIGHAIREGYHTLLPANRHPSVFLFLAMDPAAVDVNVHPTKREVRFREPGAIRDAVIAAIREALGHPAATPASSPAAGEPAAPPGSLHRPAAHGELRIEDLPPTRTFRYPRMPLADYNRPFEPPAAPPDASAAPALAPRPSPAATGADDGTDKPRHDAPWAWCRVVGQVGGLYVALETEDGFVLMDPHAAHERVLFERYLRAVLQGQIRTQALLMPETVELGPKDALRVRKILDVLKEMGFGISEFGGQSFVVDALPPEFAGLPAGPLLSDIAHSIEVAGARGGRERWREEAIAQAACKAAVKARDRLTLDEIEKLVVELAGTEMPYTCPHGRPTLIFFPFKELDRKFGRG